MLLLAVGQAGANLLVGQAGQLAAIQVVVQEVQCALAAQALLDLLAHQCVQICLERPHVQTHLAHQRDQVRYLHHQVHHHLPHRDSVLLQVRVVLTVLRHQVRHLDEVAQERLRNEIKKS